ncbi:hypothetical protein HJG60_010202 [Phyllostomus discolor]|uniref:Uncharacterized protein n=1 Tax=Phyllostomus discolor TaxID=89673 RepID=A0A834EK43_9CHIR|nr:hypothetical protein HJG60_010202 [Phyllostomus discolor]
MTTAQNGHGRVAAIPCSVLEPPDPNMVIYPACQNGECGGDTEAQDSRLGPAKLVRLFSVSRKKTGANPERPRSMMLMGHSSTWNALASFRKMGSFKKLKSSVLQGIQNREGPYAAKEEASEPDLGPVLPNGTAVVIPADRRGSSEAASGLPQPGPASDSSEPEEADDAFQRSTHRSRSLRRAYGLGRISLWDCEHHGLPLPSAIQEPPVCSILVKDSENNSISSQRSKSTDNLNFLRKGSFKRKSASNLSDLRTVPDRPTTRRTLSSCSADSEKLGGSERRTKRWKSPIRAKDFDRVLKLVSSATEAALKRERPRSGVASPSDASPRPRPCSRLHEDYSRRVSSSVELERRRCAMAPGFSPACPQGPQLDVDTSVFPLEAQSTGPCAGSSSPSSTAQELLHQDSQEPKPASQFILEPEHPLTPLRPTAPKPPSPQSPGTGNAKCANNLSALSLSSVDSDERAEGLVSFPDSVQATCDKGSKDSGSSSHPQLSLSGSSGLEEKEEEVFTEESWRRGPSLEEERTEAQRISVSRRRWGSGRRSRPRPLSDYGQLASRSLSIPEDSIAVDPQKEDIVDSGHQLSMASMVPAGQKAALCCSRGGQRRRPISVIGGVSFYGNSQTEAIENLLTQVRSGVLSPKPAEPPASWPLFSPAN